MPESLIAGLQITPPEGTVICRSERNIVGRVCIPNAELAPRVAQEAAKRGWRIHTVSSGMNWGMGSYLPKSKSPDPTLLIDLSNLKKIGPINIGAASIRLESGVTQKELYDWLMSNAPEFRFNVTGASAETSILGNSLERGLGYDGSREDDTFGFEATFPDGASYHPDPNYFSSTGSRPVGPSIDSLFFQSDLGIVTAFHLKLRRVQACEMAVIITGDRTQVFHTVQLGYHHGVLSLPTHMGGNNRALAVTQGLLSEHLGREATPNETRAVFPMREGHSAITALRGPASVVRAQLKALKRLSPHGVEVRGVTSAAIERGLRITKALGFKTKYRFLAAVRPLLALTWGEPSEAGMKSLPTIPVDEVDRLPIGLLYFNAVSSLEESASREVEDLVSTEFPDVSITRLFTPRSGVAHICSIEFEKDMADVIHGRLGKLLSTLRQRGFPPYRLGSAYSDSWDNIMSQARSILLRLAPGVGGVSAP